MSTSPTDVPPLVPPLAGPSLAPEPEVEIDYDALVTEDHAPVDQIFLEKLYRLLTRSLYASWPGPGEGRAFLVLVNVGWFYQRKTPAVVPDCLLSLDVVCPEDVHVKQGHSYYQWDMGKQPDVVIEFVSDRTGGEESYKKNLYARLGVPYYAVFDPDHMLSDEPLRCYELVGGAYRLTELGPWEKVGLGLRLWTGTFEGHEDVWLRWCDARGVIIPTGEERAAQLAEQGAQRAAQNAELVERIRVLEAERKRLKSDQPPRS
jgi:Uma2 family endonuclease